MTSRRRLGFEFLLMFFIAPLPVFWAQHTGYLREAFGIRVPLIPLMWAFAVFCWWKLRRDATFDRRSLWHIPRLEREMLGLLLRFVIFAAVMFWYIFALHPDRLFEFPQTRPTLWMAVMCLYPIFSVFPQSIIWRAFLLHRYKSLFDSTWLLWLMAVVAFGFVHLVFMNKEALILTTVGGMMFARTHLRTGSMLLAALEHALYGCWAFTVGFGSFLYGGSVHAPTG